MQALYEEYTEYKYAKKLQFLKSEIKFPIEEKRCGWYNKLLENYIDDAKTDYEPFIGSFTSQEIRDYDDELHATKCPKNILGVVPCN